MDYHKPNISPASKILSAPDLRINLYQLPYIYIIFCNPSIETTFYTNIDKKMNNYCLFIRNLQTMANTYMGVILFLEWLIELDRYVTTVMYGVNKGH